MATKSGSSPAATTTKTTTKKLGHLKKDGGVATITLDDPPANKYRHERMRQLDEAVLDCRFDDNTHVLVVTGGGEKFFSSGANISMLNAVTPGFKYGFWLHANKTVSRLEQTAKRVIAASNSHTVGGGLEIATEADLRLARKDGGKIGLPEISVGVPPGTGGTQRLARLVGEAKAIELMTSGARFPFEEAKDWGVARQGYGGPRGRSSSRSPSMRARPRRPTRPPWPRGTSSAASRRARSGPTRTARPSRWDCKACSPRAKMPRKASRRTRRSAGPSSRAGSGRAGARVRFIGRRPMQALGRYPNVANSMGQLKQPAEWTVTLNQESGDAGGGTGPSQTCD